MKNAQKFVVLILLVATALAVLAGCVDGVLEVDGVQADDEQTLLLKQAYLNYYYNGNPPSDYGPNTVFVDCFYGKFGEVLVARMSGGGIYYLMAITSETVEEMVFMYTNSARISVCYQGEILSLTQAAEQNLLTHEDLYQIWTIHKTRYGFLYN